MYCFGEGTLQAVPSQEEFKLSSSSPPLPPRPSLDALAAETVRELRMQCQEQAAHIERLQARLAVSAVAAAVSARAASKLATPTNRPGADSTTLTQTTSPSPAHLNRSHLLTTAPHQRLKGAQTEEEANDQPLADQERFAALQSQLEELQSRGEELAAQHEQARTQMAALR